MSSHLPQLSPRSFSTRRNDMRSQRTMNTALFQTTITRQINDQRSMQPQQSSKNFADDIEDFIQQSLITTKNQNDVFKVYQQAFQLLIDKFDRESPAMMVVKKGYDQIIEELQKQSQKGQQHRLVVQQSMTSLNNALQVKQEKFNKKKQGYLDLIESVKSTIADLKEEIAQLHVTIRQETKSFRAENESANQNQAMITKLGQKIQKKQEEKEEYLKSIEENNLKKVQLTEDANSAQSVLTSALNSISDSNGCIDHCHKSINSINQQIDETDQKIKQKNDKIVEYAEEKEILRKEVQSINDQAQLVRNDIDALSRDLSNVLSKSGISGHTLTMVGEDPVKLVALAISHKKGFEGGIDPDLFPDLS
ncbi:hypothetical protein M9Y10_025658 [Tritrichomonas musculus]|uniref:Translin-associated factor X-interacting protein 1 N-terminal domain-containing protein n=1 Tax=Tritrichomonas musculus TaxID=1915356 RepID=A0ABR2HB64_9EUKA